jgi:LDH2 family malate/lactate/ureidoglycolate dehydrogenase
MDTLIERVHNCPVADGFSEVLVAGELEARQEKMRRERGIPYSPEEIATLQEEAVKAGVAPLEVPYS